MLIDLNVMIPVIGGNFLFCAIDIWVVLGEILTFRATDKLSIAQVVVDYIQSSNFKGVTCLNYPWLSKNLRVISTRNKKYAAKKYL